MLETLLIFEVGKAVIVGFIRARRRFAARPSLSPEDRLMRLVVETADLERRVGVLEGACCNNAEDDEGDAGVSMDAAAGVGHSLVAVGGRCWSFGKADKGRLGHGPSSLRDEPVPRLLTCPVLLDKITVVAVAAARTHSVVLTADGQVFTFGCGDKGQLGHGDDRDRPHPTAIKLPRPASGISAGGSHTMVLLADERSVALTNLVVFGGGGEGRLGLGDDANVLTPTTVPMAAIPGIEKVGGMVAAVSAGRYHSLVLDAGGGVWAAGSNQHGQLGVGDKEKRANWTRVPGLGEEDIAVSIAAGRAHSACVMLPSGSRASGLAKIYTWGKGGHGRLGHGDEEARLSPTRVELRGEAADAGPMTQIAAGDGVTAGITADGGFLTWGDGTTGQNGLGADKSKQLQPAVGRLPAGVRAARVSAGADHLLIVSTCGRLYACGSPGKGQLGLAAGPGSSEPVKDNVLVPTEVPLLNNR